jgi:hypothetical protein
MSAARYFHMGMNVEGALREGLFDFGLTIDGRPATRAESKAWLKLQVYEGRKLVCLAGDECPGHPVGPSQ